MVNFLFIACQVPHYYGHFTKNWNRHLTSTFPSPGSNLPGYLSRCVFPLPRFASEGPGETSYQTFSQPHHFVASPMGASKSINLQLKCPLTHDTSKLDHLYIFSGQYLHFTAKFKAFLSFSPANNTFRLFWFCDQIATGPGHLCLACCGYS